MSDQDKLLDFVNDPEDLKKAVESSMEKRQKIIDQASDQTIEQRLDEILNNDFGANHHELRSLKEVKSWKSFNEQTKQSLLQLLNKARTKGYNDGFQMGQFDRDMDNTHGIANQTIEQRLDRIEVIDETGRVYVRGAIYGTPVDIELSYQDDGRTLKVFVTPKENK